LIPWIRRAKPPSPFNPPEAIGYQSSAVGHVLLMIFDAPAREVATLFEGIRQTGR
jgi:hypothetical protein